MDQPTHVAALIQRWQGVSGSERANYQLFIADLCDLLGVPHPEPAPEHTRDNAYVFERRITFAHGDGSQSNGYIDCYKRGAFVLEAKWQSAAVGRCVERSKEGGPVYSGPGDISATQRPGAALPH